MANHVEFGILQFRELREFVSELLHAVLAKQSLARLVRFNDCCGGKGLAHGHQGDFVRVATGALSGTLDAVVDFEKVGSDAHGNPSLKQKAWMISVPFAD